MAEWYDESERQTLEQRVEYLEHLIFYMIYPTIPQRIANTEIDIEQMKKTIQAMGSTVNSLAMKKSLGENKNIDISKLPI